MSRKWERMVQRNTKQINKQRKKTGQPRIGETTNSSSRGDVFKGRSIMLPLFLASVAGFFMVIYSKAEQVDSLYWITVVMYFLLAFYFFMRRPYLAVSNDTLSTRRLGGDKRMKAADVAEITIMKGYCVISFSSRRTKWVFSRTINRFDTEAMSKRLQQFATQHGIKFNVQS